MRIAFYAPMKPPTHRVPSGDRAVARLLIRALKQQGHDVFLASTLRAYDGTGDHRRQLKLAKRGAARAQRLIGEWRGAPPDLWFTYHLYHKAPDYLGPRVADAFGLPYLVAEPSVAMKQQDGPWSLGFAVAAAALRRADGLFTMTPEDEAGLADIQIDAERCHRLPPFLDTRPFAAQRHKAARHELARRYGLDPRKTWLLAVAMMRPGDKLASYRRLAAALDRLPGGDWSLLIVGDGPCRAEIESLFAGRAVFVGALPERSLPLHYAAADLFVWPAVNEAYGMALLSAQAAGVPVVAGRERGVPEVVRDGETGILTKPGDDQAFADAIAGLLADPARRAAMASRGAATVRRDHSLETAGTILTRVIDEVSRS